MWPRVFSLTAWSDRIFLSQIWATCLWDSMIAISIQCDLDITSGRRNLKKASENALRQQTRRTAAMVGQWRDHMVLDLKYLGGNKDTG